MQDIKSGSLKEESYQALTTNIFLSGIFSF